MPADHFGIASPTMNSAEGHVRTGRRHKQLGFDLLAPASAENVSKLLRTNSDPQERTQHREARRRFRHSIGITNNSLLRSLRLRDSFEHSTDELREIV